MGTLEAINNFYQELKECGKDYVTIQLNVLESDLAWAEERQREVEIERDHYRYEIENLMARIAACKNVLNWDGLEERINVS